MSAKKYVIGGNWKCNGTRESTAELVQALNEGGDFSTLAEIVVAPGAFHIGAVAATIRPEINVACQNIGLNKGSGAFTGDLSADQCADFGLKWVITGHSERRALSGESNDDVGVKTKVAIEAGLSAIACIGEQLSDRESGETLNVIYAQLEAISAHLTAAQWPSVVIAYEPVWAIGTGVVATPQQAQEACQQVRKWVAEKVSDEVATAIRVLYGGSVKGSNCQELIALPDVDGFLVGGASLKPDFINIIKCVPSA